MHLSPTMRAFASAIIIDPLFAWIFPFGFIGFWCSITFFISRLGWSGAAKRFPASFTPEGKAFYAPSVSFPSSAHYNTCVKVTVTPEGLHLAVNFLFALGCRPMLVPWTAVTTISEQKGWIGNRYLKIEIAGPHGFTIRLPMSALPRLQPFAESARIPCQPLPCI